MPYVIDHIISCSQNPAGKRKWPEHFFFFCRQSRWCESYNLVQPGWNNSSAGIFKLKHTHQPPQWTYIDILMRMLSRFQTLHDKICLFNTVSYGEDTKRHANYINFQRWNVFSCIHLLIIEPGSIWYEPGSNYQLQLLAPLRRVGDKQNKATDKTIDCHL